MADANVLEQIFKQYKNSIPEKLMVLEKLVDDVKKTGSEEALKELRMQIHKLSGNAGVYGYGHISVICKAFSEVLHKKTATINDFKIDPDWGTDFDVYLKKIKEGFSLDSTNTK